MCGLQKQMMIIGLCGHDINLVVQVTKFNPDFKHHVWSRRVLVKVIYYKSDALSSCSEVRACVCICVFITCHKASLRI